MEDKDFFSEEDYLRYSLMKNFVSIDFEELQTKVTLRSIIKDLFASRLSEDKVLFWNTCERLKNYGFEDLFAYLALTNQNTFNSIAPWEYLEEKPYFLASVYTILNPDYIVGEKNG